MLSQNVDTSKVAALLIGQARARIVNRHPFFATLVLKTPMIEDRSEETAATNGRRIKYNPDFVASLNDDGNGVDYTIFLTAHEIGHGFLFHNFRRGARDANRYNKACDYVVNQMLVDEKIGRMIPGALYDPDLFARGGGTVEGIYNLLPEETEEEKKNGKGKPGQALDNCEDASLDPAEFAELEADTQINVVQARNAAKMMGKLSAGLERLVGEIIKPKVDWKEVLRQFLTIKSKVSYSFARPKRRFISQDLFLPSLQGERMGWIAVAVDCSGSVDDKTIGIFGGEINGIHGEAKPEALKVLYFDAEILGNIVTYGPDDQIELKPRGGGGTDFRPIFQTIAAMDVPPVACVVLTDLYGEFGDEPSEYPVLWASITKDKVAPWGQTVFVDQNKL